MSFGFEIRDANNNILVNSSSYGISLIDIITIGYGQISPNGNVYSGSKTYPGFAHSKFLLTQSQIEPITVGFESANTLTTAKLRTEVSGNDKIVYWDPYFSFPGFVERYLNIYVMSIGTIPTPQSFQFTTTQDPYSYSNSYAFGNDGIYFYTKSDGKIDKSTVNIGTWCTPNISDIGELFSIQYNITSWIDDGNNSSIFINDVPRSSFYRTFTTQWYQLSNTSKFYVGCSSASGGWEVTVQGTVTIKNNVSGSTITSPLYFYSSGFSD